jgi:hypothetical protein
VRAGRKYLNHETRSQTVNLPVSAHGAFVEAAAVLTSKQRTNYLTSKRHVDVAVPAEKDFNEAAAPLNIPPNMTLTADGPHVLDEAAYRDCVAVLVDTAAAVLQSYVKEDKTTNRRIAQLTLGVTGFQGRSHQRGIADFLMHQRSSAVDEHVPVLTTNFSPKIATRVFDGRCSDCVATSYDDVQHEQPTSSSFDAVCSSSRGVMDKASGYTGSPPGGKGVPTCFDTSVWESLPEEIQNELVESWQLRDQQRMWRATGIRDGGQNDSGRKTTGSKRKAVRPPAGYASIHSFFKPVKRR